MSLVTRYPLALMLPLLMILLVYPLEVVRVGLASEVISKLFKEVMEAEGGLEFPIEYSYPSYVVRDESAFDRAIVGDPGEAEKD